MAVDFDGGVIRHLLDGGTVALLKAEKIGLKPGVLGGPADEALKFVIQYVAQNGTMPGVEVVEHHCGRPFKAVEATLEHMIARAMRRKLWELQKERVESIVESLETRDPEKTRAMVLGLVAEMDGMAVGTGATKAKNLFETGAATLEMYKNTVEGKIGVPLPWPTMNAMTMGLWPGTVTLFFGRPGMGKTFVMMIGSRHAWLNGYKCLVVSPEMSATELGERFFAVDAAVSYRDMVSGKLGAFNEQMLVKKIEERKEAKGIWVLDEPDELRPEVIESAAMDLGVDVIWIDSCYDLRVGSGPRQDRMAAISEYMRRLAKRTGKPVVAASQFNRSQDGAKSASMGGAAMSDQLAWDAHNLIGMVQTDDMRDDLIMEFDPMKVRRMAHVAKVTARWDFDTMKFDEVEVKKKPKFVDKGFEKGFKGSTKGKAQFTGDEDDLKDF